MVEQKSPSYLSVMAYEGEIIDSLQQIVNAFTDSFEDYIQKVAENVILIQMRH